MMKAYFDEPIAVPGDDQRYIVKTYESTTNSNLAVTYNNRYVMLDEVRKLMYEMHHILHIGASKTS